MKFSCCAGNKWFATSVGLARIELCALLTITFLYYFIVVPMLVGNANHVFGRGTAGFAEVKWCANRFTPFLIMDAEVCIICGVVDCVFGSYVFVLQSQSTVWAFRANSAQGSCLCPCHDGVVYINYAC